MSKKLMIMVLCLIFLVGCKKSDIAKTYNESEQDGILSTYYEMNDGTWKCDNKIYKHRLELTGRMSNALRDTYFAVLTDNDKLTFEIVAKSIYSSSTDDIQMMKDSAIVELK